MTTVEISVDRPYYYPGDTVKGNVHVVCDKPQKLRGITLEALGYERTRITESTGSGKNRHTHTYISNNFLHRFDLQLLGEDELPRGSYDYPFEYQLPAQALPSYHGFYATVVYTVTANVDIPFWFDAHETIETPVAIPSTQVTIEHTPATLYSKNAEDTTRPGFMMTVGRTMFFSGEIIKGNFELTGDGGHRIRKVDVELQLVENAVAQGHSRVYNQVISKAQIPGECLAPGAVIPFEICIPPRTSTAYNGVFSKVWYALSINVDVAWAFDADASLPVVILDRA